MNPYDISKIFNDMELDLISSLKKNLEKGGAGDWQREKLLSIATYKEVNDKIVNAHNGNLGKEISKLLKESFTAGGQNTDNILKKAGKLTVPIAKIGSDSFFKINENRINSLISSVSRDLSKAESAMLRQADDVYRQTLFKSQMNLNAGALSLNQSIDMATKEFLDKGFNCITYKDGRKVNIASYAEMVLRTSSQRAVFTGEGSRRDEWGVHTVVVSAHNNSSDLCMPWQGKIFIDDVYSSGKKGEGDYPLLSTAIDNGLFHPSCRHNMGTYFEGINTPPEAVDNKEAFRNYEAEQKQRYMERQIRKYKRHEVGSLDPQNIKRAKDKVTEWQRNLRQHLKDNPQLRRDSWREQNKIPIGRNSSNGYPVKERVIRSSDYKVDKEFLNSDEYANKFKGVGSEKLNNRICKETKDVVKKNDKLSTESMAIIHIKNNLLSKQDTGSFGGIVDLSCLKGLENNSTILTHNHPGSTSFSDYDIALLLDNPQIKTIIAAGHNGVIYKLSIGEGIRVGINKLTNRNDIFVEYQRVLRELTNNPNEVVKILSAKYNWIYEVI